MKKKSVKLIAGVVVIVLLCGAYFGLRVYNQKTEEAEEEAAAGETILEVDTSALTAVSFLIDGEEVSFSLQDDDTWQKDDDETFPVSQTALLSPLSELSELKSLRTLTEIEDASEYGFDEPQNLITLTDEDGNETIVTIGSNNDSTGNDYLMLNEDTTTVYTVSTDLREGFSDDLYDYAESEELPSFLASDVTGILVETADGENYELYIEDSVWMVSGASENGADDADVTAEELEEGVEADSDEADTLTSTVAGISYVDFLDHNCSDFSEYGLDEPAVTLTITYEEEVEAEDETDAEATSEETDLSDEEEEAETEAASEEESETETEQEAELIEQTVIFYIGDTDDSGNYYVRFGDSLEVHTISSSTVSTLLGYTPYDLVAEPEEETETETEAGTETEAETETETEAETETATDTETDAEAENETDTEIETATETEGVTEDVAEAEMDEETDEVETEVLTDAAETEEMTDISETEEETETE
ncbi:MAG: DUF4340 domain-containing protein [Lachnospiraceae bacterium]|nr:DUF4340 domain-containing protein [Lachnospiraceae bacterium]